MTNGTEGALFNMLKLGMSGSDVVDKLTSACCSTCCSLLLCGKIKVLKRCEKIALWAARGPWTAMGWARQTVLYLERRRNACEHLTRIFFSEV